MYTSLFLGRRIKNKLVLCDHAAPPAYGSSEKLDLELPYAGGVAWSR